MYVTSVKQIGKERSTFNENKDLLTNFAETKRIYEDFKRLRKVLGKPVTDKLDPSKIRKDLSGRDFFC
jgi:hypothetical protein